jgi:S1-C subfamily serine protease
VIGPENERVQCRRGYALLRICMVVVISALCLPGCLSTASTATMPTPVTTETESQTMQSNHGLVTGRGAPFHPSMALLRSAGSGRVTGVAVVIAGDGFLLTDETNLPDDVEVLLSNGRSVRPVRVTTDSATGLALLKVPTSDLEPLPIANQPVESGDAITASVYDTSGSAFVQRGGNIRAVSPLSNVPDGTSALIETDIPTAGGLGGGVLSNDDGAVVGLIVSGNGQISGRLTRALSGRYLMTWFNRWRETAQRVDGSAENWPVLEAPGILTMRYPTGWAVTESTEDAGSFRAEVAPSDPDAALQLGLSIEPSVSPDDPMAFAEQEFGNTYNAAIWGAVEYAKLPGVRVALNQEGARIDIVYLFDGDRRIAVRLTSGYSSGDVSKQAEQAAALFEAMLKSITLVPPSGR